MCLICVELAKDKLTAIEARRNLGEFINIIDESHRIEVLNAIWKKEDEESRGRDEEYDWYDDEMYGDTD